MRTHGDSRHQHARLRRRWRRGAVLVLTALLLPVLLGVTGLVIDAGLLMVSSRKAQNAADAAATAAAVDLLLGRSLATARTTATTYVRTHNRLARANVTTNIPPTSGPYQGNSKYIEVIVRTPVQTVFIQVLGVNSERGVRRRAVAGIQGSSTGAGVMMLDPARRPGFSASGNGSLNVNGMVVVNSDGGGMNERGQPINNGNSGSAIRLSGNARLTAVDILSVGGITTSGNAGTHDYNNTRRNPLRTGMPISPDPLLNLPVPTTANGAVAAFHPEVSLSGNQSVVLSPGVYPSIRMSGNADAVFSPGIYIITGGGMSLSGNGDVSGTGVLIYNTGSDFNVYTGMPDAADADNPPSAPSTTKFDDVSLSGNGQVRFTPIDDPSSPFDGLGFYQRRWNTQEVSITGNGNIGAFRGTIYAKWAGMALSGNGRFAAQFIVRDVTLSGNGDITVDATGQKLIQVNQARLVE